MTTPDLRTSTGPVPQAGNLAGDTLVSSTRNIFRDDFNGSGTGVDAVDPAKWDISIGAGMTVSASSSTLLITSGTTVGATTLVSKASFSVPFRALMAFKQSVTKQANQAIRLEMVAVNADGTLDENNKLTLETTTAGTGTSGWSALSYSDGNSASNTGTVTVFTAENLFEVSYDPDQATFAWGTPGTTSSASSRYGSLARDNPLPDPNRNYKLRITVINDAGFAGVTNTYRVYHAVFMDVTEVQAEITGGRGRGEAVQVTGSLAINPYLNSGASGSATFFKRISTADTNAVVVNSAATGVGFIHCANNSASWRYLKLFNKTSAPVLGTDVPALTIGIPPNNIAEFDPTFYPRFSSGVSMAITAGIADLDATAIGAGEVVVNIGRA